MLVSVVVQLQSSPATSKLSSMRALIVSTLANWDALAFFVGRQGAAVSNRGLRSVNKFPDLWRENHAPQAMGSGGACVLHV
jgi:hypothetical protein